MNRSPEYRLAPTYPLRASVPYKNLMRVITRSLGAGSTDSQLARAIEDAVSSDERLTKLIDTDAARSGGPLARPELIREQYSHWRLSVRSSGLPGQGASWRIADDRVPAGAWRTLLGAVPPSGGTQVAQSIKDASATGGAVMRREHASVEIQSPSGTRILFDPVFRSMSMNYADRAWVPEPGVAAAFVTHSHGDHFELASLDHLAASGTTAYVPAVPHPSFLAEDMDAQLASCGLPRQVCELGSLTRVEDITVEALPFYGEQPSASVGPVDADLRNFGNCYRVDTPAFSALLLADSGRDPAGSMLAAIRDSVRRTGPIDIVLGCLRSIFLPFEVDGLPCYYTSLPMSGIRTDHELLQRGKLPSATLGLSGTAAACAEAQARIFLPYAHGMTDYGQPVGDNLFGPGTGLDELSACRSMAQELRRIGCPTEVVGWNTGDTWTPRGIRPAVSSPVAA